jgi:hypothetical protein
MIGGSHDRRGDSWTLAQWEGEDGLYLVRTRDRAPDDAERATFPVVIRVYWTFDADDQGDDEFPDDDTFDDMEAFETTLYRAMESGGWGVGVAAITGGGQKEWLFYAADADEFAQQLNAALDDHDIYPITLEVGQDPEWSTFAEIMPKGTVH